jgi:hypothetical protein
MRAEWQAEQAGKAEAERLAAQETGGKKIWPALLPGVAPEGRVQAEAEDETEPDYSSIQCEPYVAEERPQAALPVLAAQIEPELAFDNVLEAMNQQHAIIASVTGKAVIASWEPSSLDPSKMVIVYQTKDSFLLRYSNRRVRIEVRSPNGDAQTVWMPLAQWWLGQKGRRQYRGITFLPGGPEVVGGVLLNLWRGWGCEPKKGDWRLMRRHIEDVLAGGNKEAGEYLIRWLAWSIQNPAKQAEAAVVLIGAKGTGKGTLVRCLKRIFGAHLFQVTRREHVIDKFNGHLQDAVLFVADEAYWGGDKRCVGALQGMITEETLAIENKHFDVVEVPNMLHILMLAEPGWIIPAGPHERRYAAFSVSKVHMKDKGWFGPLHKQIDNGGAEAMFWDLQRMDLGDWHPRDIPDVLLQGAALRKQQERTLPPLEQWWLAILQDGLLPVGAKWKKPYTALTAELRDDAKERVPRLRFDLSDVALADFLTDVDRIGVACEKWRSAAANGWTFPALAECRAAWEAKYGPVQWGTDAEDWAAGPNRLERALAR